MIDTIKRSAMALAAASILAVLALACAGSTPSAASLLADGLKAQQAGKVDEAAADYRKVIALDPKNKYGYYDLGVIDQQAGRAAQAEANYRQALIIDPNFTNALFNLAILRTQPAPYEALHLYQHVIAVEPKNSSAHLNLGFLLVSLGQTAEGKAELATAVSLDPAASSRIPANLLPLTTPTPTPPRPTATPTR